MPCPVCATGLHLTERHGIERVLSPVPQCLVRLGDSIRSSRVHGSCPPPLPGADSGTLQNGLRAWQSVGGRTPHVPATPAHVMPASAVMAMSACGAPLA